MGELINNNLRQELVIYQASMKKPPSEPKPIHQSGHRTRLRTRFLKTGLEGFPDYEALELLLLYVARQKDMKPIAKELISQLGSFRGVLDASDDELLAINGVGKSTITFIHFIKQAATRYLEQTGIENVKQQDISSLIQASVLKMSSLPNEQFRIISLNSDFKVVGEDIVSDGTIDQTTVYPRKIIEFAIKHGATTLILFHNHPGGDTTPSEMDKILTQAIVLATKPINIQIFDHIILSRNGMYSFRENKML